MIPATPQMLAAALDEEQRRQDAHLEAIRALVTDSRSLRLLADADRPTTFGGGSKPEPTPTGSENSLLASLGRRLRGRRDQKKQKQEQQETSKGVSTSTGRGSAGRGSAMSVEDQLRGRIAAALQETRRASLLVDRFAALREALFADLERLNQAIDEARSKDTETSGKVVVHRVAGDDEARTDRERDESRRARARGEQEAELAVRYADRLSVVCAGARGLLDVIDTLSADVAGFARAAERELDQLSARARALSVAEDAQAVVEELERSLLSLSGSLDDVTVFASAVHERVSQTSSSQGLAHALDTLVQGALARRAATAAREQASGS